MNGRGAGARATERWEVAQSRRSECPRGRRWTRILVTNVPYREHVPPDVTACIFWLKNRDSAHWRDAWQVEHTLGKYVIADRPMTAVRAVKARRVKAHRREKPSCSYARTGRAHCRRRSSSRQ
jgi:hypothetical protein